MKIFSEFVRQEGVLHKDPRSTPRAREERGNFWDPAAGQTVHRHLLLQWGEHQGEAGEFFLHE